MKTIQDIRVYKSESENADGHPLPHTINNKALNIVIHRIVMKLRESQFTLGSFDHLYINFTVCLENGEIRPAKRSVDPYHPWYRFYDVGVSEDIVHTVEVSDRIDLMIQLVERVLLTFANNDQTQESIKESVSMALTQKEQMLMRYKEKKSSKNSAIVFLRYLDSGMYEPLVCVYDSDGKELMRTVLHQTLDLMSIGEILLSSKRVTIKPKKNVLAHDLLPITFDINQ